MGTSGGSDTPLADKLGIRAGSSVAVLGAPAGFDAGFGGLPDGVRVRTDARGTADAVVLFAGSRSELKRRFPVARRVMREGAGLWIAWPKRASGVSTDITQSAVRTTGLDAGLVDHKIVSMDETWSALRFAARRR